MIHYISEDIYDELHLEFMQIISQYYDGDIAKAQSAAQDMIELTQNRIEEEFSNAE